MTRRPAKRRSGPEVAVPQPEAPQPSSGRPSSGQPSSGDFRRRRRLAAALVALLLFVGLGLTARVLLYDAGLADVEGVRVTGAVTVPVPDVLTAAAVTPGGPLADLDLDAVAARVARVPGVARVAVAREWPHTVSVEVTERVPVASAETDGGPALVDGTGVGYAGTPPPGLPRLTFREVGPDDPATRAALAALAALPDPVRAQVLTVDVAVAAPGVPAQVSFGLTGDRRIRWGAPERAADKAAALGPLLTQPGIVYDVTSPDLPTVRR